MMRIKTEIRSWNLNHQTQLSITQIAEKFNPKIRGWLNYYSKFGKTKQLAETVAAAAGTEAHDIENPLNEEIDILFLGSSVYAAVVDWRVKKFIATLDPQKIKNVVLFGSSAILESPYSIHRKALEQCNLHVDDREFHCPGQLAIMHRGRPNRADHEALHVFVNKILSDK